MSTFLLRAMCLSMLALPLGVAAADFSYSNAELRLIAVDPDRGDDADGIALSGSFDLGRRLFVSGGFSSLDGDGRFGGMDTDTLDTSLGLYHPVSPRVDLFATAGLVYVDLSVPGAADDDDLGPLVTGGARAWITPRFELGGYGQYIEVFSDGDVSLNAEALYHFTPELAALGGAMVSDDDRGISAGVRWNFPVARRQPRGSY